MAYSRRLWAAALALSIAAPATGQEMTRGNSDSMMITASNQRVANMIAERLAECHGLKKFNVEVVYQNGIAEISGAVANDAQRAQVLRVAGSVPGVKYVRDRMDTMGMIHQAQAVSLPIQEQAPPPALAPTQPPPPNGIHQGMITNGNGPMPEPAPIMQGPPPSYYDVNPPKMPPHAWPTYAPYNNYSRVATPQLYPYNAWPYIGPMYPFPKIPPGWRKVQLEWQDGYWWYSNRGNSHDWWMLRFW